MNREEVQLKKQAYY